MSKASSIFIAASLLLFVQISEAQGQTVPVPSDPDEAQSTAPDSQRENAAATPDAPAPTAAPVSPETTSPAQSGEPAAPHAEHEDHPHAGHGHDGHAGKKSCSHGGRGHHGGKGKKSCAHGGCKGKKSCAHHGRKGKKSCAHGGRSHHGGCKGHKSHPEKGKGAGHSCSHHEESPAASALVVKSSFFTRYEAREGYDDIGRVGRRFGEGDGAAYRARLSLATTPMDIGNNLGVVVRFVPQASGFWGDVSGGLADAVLGLHEGDIRITSDSLSLQVGRFEMVYGEHLVIGNVGWHETGRAFDGLRLQTKLSAPKSFVDVFATSIREGTFSPTPSSVFGAGDRYFVGAYAGLGPLMGANLELDTYAFANIAPQNEEAMVPQSHTAIEFTLGSRFKKTVDQVALRAEAGLQLGKRPTADESVFAFHVDADAMFAATPAFKFGAGGFFASGDDPTSSTDEGWNQLYPTAHKFLGFMDIIGGRTNIAGGTAKLRLQATDPLSFALDAHVFVRPETIDGVDAYTGTEGDLWMLYKLGKGLGLRTQYAMFVPNESGPLGDDGLIHYVEVQLAFSH